jgi:hypothetical protein
MGKTTQEVDRYLADLVPDRQAALTELRALIQEAVPDPVLGCVHLTASARPPAARVRCAGHGVLPGRSLTPSAAPRLRLT